METVTRIYKRYYVRQILIWLMVNLMFFGLPVCSLAGIGDGGWNIRRGSAIIDAVGGDSNATIELTSRRAVIEWQNFDTIAGQTVTFTRTGGERFRVLNRVVSGVGTTFNGSLFGNQGFIILSNPKGITFGSTAYIQARSFAATGLLMDFDKFMNDDFLEFGKVTGDKGEIRVLEGAEINVDETLALLGSKVFNAGTISAPGGLVVVAAGDSVYLGDPAGKAIVEMTGIEDGLVQNTGEIGTEEDPVKKVVLAAGDIYSIPLHPQLQAGTIEDKEYDYADAADKAVIDEQPIRVETGTGSVQQLGIISADGPDGQVVLTAGDEVVLGDSSSTSSVDGEVTTYAYDFGDKAATTYFNSGAEVSVGTGTAEISGNHIYFNGTVSALPGAILQVDPVTLTIADGGIPAGGAAMDTIYEQQVESYSQSWVHLDLAADDLITVEYMADGEIFGGSGDITLRNVFDNGGINFLPNLDGERTTIRTTPLLNSGNGGGIFMLAGSGGITAGDLITETLSNDKISDPGPIRLLATNGGDIEVGTMSVSRGGFTEISAIASGNLTVNGDAISINTTVPKEEKSVGQARICLIAGADYDPEDPQAAEWEPKDVVFNGDQIKVEAHGKYETTADIRISATGNVYLGSAENDVKISAEAKTSQSKDATRATAYTVIHAGRTNPVAGEIVINGETYTSGLGYLSTGDIIAKAWPGPLSKDTSDAPDSSSGTESVWQETGDPADKFFVRIEIDNHESAAIGDGPCLDCPTPPGLPPVPHIFWIMDDTSTISWSAVDAPIDVLANDDGGSRLYEGDITNATMGGGTWTITVIGTDDKGNDIIGFLYTPPSDAVFVWDGTSDHAVYTDTFMYKAIDAQGDESINYATVTVSVTNYLPTASGDSKTIHMNTPANPTSADFELSSLITDSDGSPGSLTYGLTEPEFGNESLAGSTATYVPYEGYVGDDSFDYTVTDSSIDYQGNPVTSAELDVTMENVLPTGDAWLGTTHMDTPLENVGLAAGGFTDGDGDSVTAASGTYDGAVIGSDLYGGTLTYDGDYSYTPDAALPGYVGDDADAFGAPGYVADDKFTVDLFDGQYDYVKSEDPVAGYDLYIDNPVGPDVYRKAVYGEGTVSVDITNTLPSGDAWLGTTHMDTPLENVSLADGSLADGDGDSVTTGSGPYNGSVIGSDLYGGTLTYDGDYTYTPDAALPGYVGDDADTFGAPGYVADDKFTVELYDGQRDYVFDSGGEIVSNALVAGEGAISVDITNERPSGDSWLGTTHMDTSIVDGTLQTDGFTDPDGDAVTVGTGPYDGSVIGSDLYGGILTYDGDYSYTPDAALPGYVGDDADTFGAPGYVADDKFTVELYDGERDYVFDSGGEIVSNALVASEGTVSVDLTNTIPTASGNLGQTPQGTVLVVPQVGTNNPVKVIDGDGSLDNLSILPGTYTGSAGGTLVFDGTTWTYTPASGYIGTEEFDIQVWDGQNSYGFIEGVEPVATPQYGEGTVSVIVSEKIIPPPPPAAPAPPLYTPEIPQDQGCPVLLAAASSEIGIASDDIQILIANALAINPSLHPCQSCGKLLDSAAVLADEDGSRMAALAELINAAVPVDQPFSPEAETLIASALAENLNVPGSTQALASEYVDAFVNYIAAGTELGLPEGDVRDVAMAKYGSALEEPENANIRAYVEARIAGL